MCVNEVRSADVFVGRFFVGWSIRHDACEVVPSPRLMYLSGTLYVVLVGYNLSKKNLLGVSLHVPVRSFFLRLPKPKRAYSPPPPISALFNRFTPLHYLAKGACRLSDMLWPTSWCASARDL